MLDNIEGQDHFVRTAFWRADNTLTANASSIDSNQAGSDNVSQTKNSQLQTVNLQRSEQAIVNAIYAGIAWLILDFGLLLLAHGTQTLSILVSRPEMAAGAIITIACIAGLFYKSRLAAIVLFLIFLLPLILRTVQGVFPSTILLLFSLILLYFFLTAVLGTFSYHHLKTSTRNVNTSD